MAEYEGHQTPTKMCVLRTSQLSLPLWSSVSPYVRELHSGQTTDTLVHCTMESPSTSGNIPVTNLLTWSRTGNGLGISRQLLKLSAELVDVVIIQSDIGRVGARSQ